MKKTKVLASKHLPGKLPVWQSLSFWLALEHWNAPEWLYGAVGLLLLFLWGFSIHRIFTQEQVDFVVKEKEPEIDKEDK